MHHVSCRVKISITNYRPTRLFSNMKEYPLGPEKNCRKVSMCSAASQIFTVFDLLASLFKDIKAKILESKQLKRLKFYA